MKVIAVANQKGGVGKTTTSVNLGCALAQRGERILLIDLDPQGNATSSFGFPGDRGRELVRSAAREWLRGREGVADAAQRDVYHPGRSRSRGAEIEIARMENHLTRLSETLAPFRNDNTFDYVLLDCPPSLGILMTNALAAADELLTPIQCEFFALEGLVKIVRVVDQIRNSGANDGVEIAGL
jgi:chromosome partitioning protein